MAVEVATIAPDFTLNDADGNSRTLNRDWVGRNVILAFFPAAGTSVCTQESCTLRDNADRYDIFNAEVVGVSGSSAADLKAWAGEHSLSFTLLTDPDHEIIDLFGAQLDGPHERIHSRRAIYVLDQNRTVHFAWVGEPAEEPPYDAVQAVLDVLPR